MKLDVTNTRDPPGLRCNNKTPAHKYQRQPRCCPSNYVNACPQCVRGRAHTVSLRFHFIIVLSVGGTDTARLLPLGNVTGTSRLRPTPPANCNRRVLNRWWPVKLGNIYFGLLLQPPFCATACRICKAVKQSIRFVGRQLEVAEVYGIFP